VFEERPKNGLVGLRLAAYGSILCICRVTFDDGYQVVLSHYVDVEIGELVGASSL
jgi:hypothetical protein